MKVKDFLKGMGALALLMFFVIVGFAMISSMIKVFGEYTSAIEPTIVVAIISGLVAIVVNAISKYGERKNQVLTKSKEKMTGVYESFLNDFNNAHTEQIGAVFDKYQSAFAVNASDDTYKEFLLLKDSENKDVSRLVVSIRNELKISNKKNKER